MDPITIAAGIAAAGSLFKGISGLFGGLSKSKAEQLAAQQADNQAGVNAGIALQQGDEVAAKAATQAAANGGGFTGSSLGVIQNLSQRAMFNARAQVYRGQSEAQAHLYAGKVAKTQGFMDLAGGVLGAASSVASGGSDASSLGALG